MVTATVSVMSDDVTLERNVVVMVINSSGTADSGIVYMPTCTCTCVVVEYCVWQWSAYMYNVAIVLCA